MEASASEEKLSKMKKKKIIILLNFLDTREKLSTITEDEELKKMFFIFLSRRFCAEHFLMWGCINKPHIQIQSKSTVIKERRMQNLDNLPEGDKKSAKYLKETFLSDNSPFPVSVSPVARKNLASLIPKNGIEGDEEEKEREKIYNKLSNEVEDQLQGHLNAFVEDLSKDLEEEKMRQKNVINSFISKFKLKVDLKSSQRSQIENHNNK